jgi:hypothetical protein
MQLFFNFWSSKSGSKTPRKKSSQIKFLATFYEKLGLIMKTIRVWVRSTRVVYKIKPSG